MTLHRCSCDVPESPEAPCNFYNYPSTVWCLETKITFCSLLLGDIFHAFLPLCRTHTYFQWELIPLTVSTFVLLPVCLCANVILVQTWSSTAHLPNVSHSFSELISFAISWVQLPLVLSHESLISSVTGLDSSEIPCSFVNKAVGLNPEYQKWWTTSNWKWKNPDEVVTK